MITVTQPKEVIASKITELHEEVMSEWFGISCMKTRKAQTRDASKSEKIKYYISVGSKNIIKKAAEIVLLLDLKVEHMTNEEVMSLSENYNDDYAKKFVNEQFVFEAFYTGDDIVNLIEVYDNIKHDTDTASGSKGTMNALLEAAASAE